MNCSQLYSMTLVRFVKRSKKKTDCELVNLRINLEEAKNENSTVLQVVLTSPRLDVWIEI